MATMNYKCPNCDGPLRFDPDKQLFTCEYCLSEFPAAEVQAMNARAEQRETYDEREVKHAEQAKQEAKLLSSLFGFEYKEDENGVSAGAVSFMKNSDGAKGCIIINTLNGDRAAAYIKRMGKEIDPDIWYDKKGNISCFGLKDTVAGFEICIETK